MCCQKESTKGKTVCLNRPYSYLTNDRSFSLLAGAVLSVCESEIWSMEDERNLPDDGHTLKTMGDMLSFFKQILEVCIT